MTGHATPPPFSMPMFRDFVPSKIRPWIYVAFALSFQFSGGLYLGTLNEMMGQTSLMREDLLMCLYANLAGMAIYFPLLFRMKFRFTNKTLLCTAATGVLFCNLLAPHVSYLPLLWFVCFIEGMCKIQGTFECMSNIQLWITPARDFTVFFPVLHIIILGSMQLSDFLSAYLMYYYNWNYMQLFISGWMTVNLFVLTICTRHFRMFKKFPLYGIDWIGGILWAAFVLETAFLFNYGDFYDWWNSSVIRQLTAAALLTLCLCIWRMFHTRHAYYEPHMWTYRHLVPILVMIALVEMLLAAEHVLEETFFEEVMHYGTTTVTLFDWPALLGSVAGCLFSLWWMHVRRLSYLRLIAVGLAGIGSYLAVFYFTVSPDIHMSQLYLPIACRGFAYAVLSIAFMTCLEEIVEFRHFFQALSVFNILHMVVGGVIGAATYVRGLEYRMTDAACRYAARAADTITSDDPAAIGQFLSASQDVMATDAIKQIYGWAAYVGLTLLLLSLLFDAPAGRALRSIPAWQKVRKAIFFLPARKSGSKHQA